MIKETGVTKIAIVYLLFLLNLVIGAQGNESVTSIESLENELKLAEDTSRINTLNKLYLYYARTDLNKADSYAREAFALSKTLDYKTGLATSLNYLGNSYIQLGKTDSARIQFTDALNIFKETKDSFGEAKVLNNLGITHEQEGESNLALKYYLLAYDLFESLKSSKELASICNNLGTIYYLQNNPDKALHFFERSLNARDKEDLYGRKQSLANIASIYYESWDLESAELYYNQCLVIEKELNDFQGMGKTYNSIGNIYLERNNLDSAEYYFNKAIPLSAKTKDQLNLIALNNNLGLVYQKRGNYSKAIKLFQKNLSNPAKLKLKPEQLSTYQYMAQTYALDKNYFDAYKSYQLYESVKSELLIEQGQMAETEAIFLKQRHENEILKFEKEQEIRRRQMVMLLAIALIIILSTIFIFFYSRIKHQIKLDKALSEQQKLQFKLVLEAQESERKRIAGDLHDSVGQILAITKLNTTELLDLIYIEDQEQKDLSNKVLEYIDEACNEVRSISHALMPGALIRLGLASAIKELIRKYGTSEKLKINFEPEPITDRLQENTEITLYRIVQELLSNIIKHANASKVNISLKKVNRDVVLCLEDNGVGLNRAQSKNSLGIGWKNIYSRLEILNGYIEFKTPKQGGTQLKITIPENHAKV